MNNINILNLKTFSNIIDSIKSYIAIKKQYNSNKKIILNFFNTNIPCLKTTQRCEELRKSFLDDISRVKKISTCTSCSLVFIKNEYIKKLLDAQQIDYTIK